MFCNSTPAYSYFRVGPPQPLYKLRDLTAVEEQLHVGQGYVKYEAYPVLVGIPGRFWTQAQLDRTEDAPPVRTALTWTTSTSINTITWA